MYIIIYYLLLFENIFSRFIQYVTAKILLAFYVLIFAAYKCSKLDFPSKKLMQEYALLGESGRSVSAEIEWSDPSEIIPEEH